MSLTTWKNLVFFQQLFFLGSKRLKPDYWVYLSPILRCVWWFVSDSLWNWVIWNGHWYYFQIYFWTQLWPLCWGIVVTRCWIGIFSLVFGFCLYGRTWMEFPKRETGTPMVDNWRYRAFKLMDNLKYHIDSTNLHLFLIPGDDASLNESCISVSEVIFCLKMMYKALHRHKLHQ